MNPQTITHFCKFAIVGASGVLVNNVVLYLCHDIASLSLIPSSIIAIETSVLSNFALNAAWTFADYKNPVEKLCKFHIVSAIPIFANLGVLYFFANSGMYYLYANLLGIIAGTAWNFVVNLKWTWKM